MKTWAKGARIKPNCDLESFQLLLREIGKSLQYGNDFVKLTDHCKWGCKSFKEGDDIIFTIHCQANEESKDE
jgi:hypothetical protein